MDRRKYLKTLALGTAGAGVLLQTQSCEPKETAAAETPAAFTIDRNAQELVREQKLASEKFFDAHEMKTISVLADIIIPKDETSGSATDAGVPDFIEFMAKDRPNYQIPLRGGIKWLDLQCMRRYNSDFASCSSQQQIEMVDEIAYPEKAKPEMAAGVAFFNTMRDLTACGFFSSKMGIADLGYAGNKPNQWDGVPQEVLDQYGVKYDDRTLEISVKFNS
ncbi:gluconate 2-dehydrogenase subunit 3 family protein [Fulvivirgaceae bacterium PWU4]|uniref:Gluconate 2-dehydrogenase subunit 3 family protein n=1 Tax=Chryseosolibacter histidini TaxID=2782349 RepID=A0AAP2GQZ9_9BACT|nr:gluconate 2-dehydrogenase subunit 3 family protein [Chryseosolibacter histidini]MBT1700658.1 gluconate 2-dehydrogenase subunit 3 family protein [Chryseosolibacter histidini]